MVLQGLALFYWALTISMKFVEKQLMAKVYHRGKRKFC